MNRLRRSVRFSVGRASAAAVLLSVVAPAAMAHASHRGPAEGAAPAVVVAVVDEPGGVNVLHDDFRTRDGKTPAYPPGMPEPVMVSLPHGSYSAARAAAQDGPLGHMRPGVLYAVAGTRLLLVNAGTSDYDALQTDAEHATGVADSITGTRHGTDPDALVVVVLSNFEGVYPWLAANRSWVDLASASSYTLETTGSPTQCGGANDVRRYAAAGRVFFSSAGNTTDPQEPLIAPNGLPETYIVGGVDSAGNTWTPGHPEETDPYWTVGNVVRPYETGELYSYPAAAPDSSGGTVHFGGTSGATPRTAGWAARLVAHARTTVRQSRASAAGTLASGPRQTRSGPLADGRLTRAELVAVLHAVAVPHSGLPDGPAYAAEGYGALGAAPVARAERILDGVEPMPSRRADDAADAGARQARAVAFMRC
jgi:hypothetical protein